MASEESAIREICPKPEKSWMPRAGEPVVARVSEKGRQKAIAQAHRAPVRAGGPAGRRVRGGVMALTTFIRSEFRVRIDREACLKCGRCVQQCGWNVYHFDEARTATHPRPRQVRRLPPLRDLLPGGAITIEKNPLAYKDSDSMSPELRKAIWRQAETGGVLLTGMGNDKPYLRIFDHLLLDACQVTNPSIDPLREPMELRTFLGRKPDSDRGGRGAQRAAACACSPSSTASSSWRRPSCSGA